MCQQIREFSSSTYGYADGPGRIWIRSWGWSTGLTTLHKAIQHSGVKARIKAIIRRMAVKQQKEKHNGKVLVTGDPEALDLEGRRVYIAGKRDQSHGQEFDVLELLLTN